MKLTPREAKSQRIEQSAELAHEYLIRCLACYRTTNPFLPAGAGREIRPKPNRIDKEGNYILDYLK